MVDTPGKPPERLTAELVSSIRKEAVGYIAKAAIATAAGIIGIAGLGLWLYVKNWLPDVVGGVPRGAVVAFDRDDLGNDRCPRGWTSFLEARGRTIVGAGNPETAPGKMAYDETGRQLRGYVLRQHGGEQLLARVEEDRTPRGALPHANMIPYIALYYCKKD
jgi:hypothetical protein